MAPDAGSSTPSWPAGCSATPGSGSARSSSRCSGCSLEKGHSAADWSTRPLPEPWLRYAALDVEVLVELRDALAAELDAQGKREWAEQEFAAVVAAPPPPPRVDPWRRTSGLHRVRKRRQLAVVRALWERRDEVARRRDIAPGRVLPDAAIVVGRPERPPHRGRPDRPAGLGRPVAAPPDRDLAAGDPRRAGPARRRAARPQDPARGPAAGPQLERAGARLPPPGWPRRATAVAALADEHRLPVENLLAPDTVRRLCWEPPGGPAPDAAAVGEFLRGHGARPWQVGLTAAVLSGALDRAARRTAVDD